MPILRPFRALRFDASAVDLSGVLAPPYDVIDPEGRTELLARDPHNAVRIELPADLGRAEADDYRAAARTVAAWRSSAVLLKDREPTITLHEMSWLTAEGDRATATGLLARVLLEDYASDAGVRPHERTMGGPKEDRYRLLKATGLNTSPIMFLAGSEPAATASAIGSLTSRAPDARAATPDGIEHRVWIVGTTDPGRPGDIDAWHRRPPPPDDPAAALLALVGSAPLTIADGHHRYETALRYRDERRANPACESDPPSDYVLGLVYPIAAAPPALPTHRLLEGEPAGAALLEALGEGFAVEPMADADAVVTAMARSEPLADGATGTGRIGVISGDVAAIVRVGASARERLLDGELSAASRGLDVNVLGAAIERATGDDVATLAADGRLSYVKDAAEAARRATETANGTAFLLDPMPAAAISEVAGAGEVMPQKSTYFHPKAPTGLLFSPMEW